MVFFIDYEFIEHFVRVGIFNTRLVHTVEPIELGIVAENGKELRVLYNDFDIEGVWQHEWLKENVLKKYYESDRTVIQGLQFGIFKEFDYKWFKNYVKNNGVTKDEAAKQINDFVRNQSLVSTGSSATAPEFYGYFCDYDWVAFCQTFGTMMVLPKGYPMFCYDLKQMFDEKIGKLYDEKKHIVQAYSTNTGNYQDVIESKDKTKEMYVSAIKNMKSYPKQNNEHSALDDARWNKELFNFLTKL